MEVDGDVAEGVVDAQCAGRNEAAPVTRKEAARLAKNGEEPSEHHVVVVAEQVGVAVRNESLQVQTQTQGLVLTSRRRSERAEEASPRA